MHYDVSLSTPIKEEILNLLCTIKGRGSFLTSKVKDFVLPGMTIRGLGEVRFPIDTYQVKKIIAAAHQAPYGQGSQTIVDTSVRNVWEIDAKKIRFQNPKWKESIQTITEEIKNDLGLEGVSIQANLYKLLLYEQGGFFLPHKDSEKEKGMFGTLVVYLPSQYTGGALLVRFEGKEKTIDFSSSVSQYEMGYAAFFADCEHEVKPIESGHRLCLVYNLVRLSNSEALPSASYAKQAERLSQLLKEAEPTFLNQPKAILLDHEYTPANFSLTSLKRHDTPRAMAVIEAAETAGYFAELALVTKYKMGSAEYEDYDYYGRSSPENLVMEEVYEEETYIEKWCNDTIPGLGAFHLSEAHIISNHALDTGKPSEEEEEGYTGNAGMTLEYWYFHGAVVIWPKKAHLSIIHQLPIEVKLKWLKYYHNKNKHLSKAIKIIKNLSENNCTLKHHREDYSIVAIVFIEAQNAHLVQEQIPLLENVFDRISIDSWTKLVLSYDFKIFEALFQKVTQSGNIPYVKHYLQIIKSLTNTNNNQFTEYVKKEMSIFSHGSKEIDWNDRNKKENISEIVKLILSLGTFYDTSTEDQFFERISSSTKRPYVNNILAPNIIALKKADFGSLAKKLTGFCKKELEKRTAQKPTPPPNFRRAIPKSNGYKAIWEMLGDFLHSETKNVFDYKAKKEHRLFVENAIRSTIVDLKMQTIHKGSPHTLRLTKTDGSYRRSLKKWQEDDLLLKQVVEKEE